MATDTLSTLEEEVKEEFPGLKDVVVVALATERLRTTIAVEMKVASDLELSRSL